LTVDVNGISKQEMIKIASIKGKKDITEILMAAGILGE